MPDDSTKSDNLRKILVPIATLATIAFNYLAAIGKINDVTPDRISSLYPTLLTPAGYAFSIWSLIYIGLIAFSLYQLRADSPTAIRAVRPLYVLSCALNVGWIYCWHHNLILLSLILIVLLAITLFLIQTFLPSPVSRREYWLTKAPFGLYFGWVTAASLVNFMVWLRSIGFQMSLQTETEVAITLIAVATLLAVLVCIRLRDHIYPLAIAWALTAIAVAQQGQTAIIGAAAAGVVVSLVTALSFVISMPASKFRRES
ncbi:MAG: hypothetical protein C4324_03455 [Blastocatellia bacterium]